MFWLPNPRQSRTFFPVLNLNNLTNNNHIIYKLHTKTYTHTHSQIDYRTYTHDQRTHTNAIQHTQKTNECVCLYINYIDHKILSFGTSFGGRFWSATRCQSVELQLKYILARGLCGKSLGMNEKFGPKKSRWKEAKRRVMLLLYIVFFLYLTQNPYIQFYTQHIIDDDRPFVCSFVYLLAWSLFICSVENFCFLLLLLLLLLVRVF